MLLNVKFKQGDIVSFRLITGEEVIAAFENISETTLTVVAPIIAQVHQDPKTGKLGLVFGDYFTTTEPNQSMEFNRANILNGPHQTTKDYAEKYSEILMPKSNIIQPEKPKLIV